MIFIKSLKKAFLFGLILACFLLPILVLAQSDDEIFKAEVIEILDTSKVNSEDGLEIIQQNILLKGLGGIWKDKEVIFYGIDDYSVISNNVYMVGDKVLVVASPGLEGEENYYITDYVRYPYMWWLVVLFLVAVIWVGRWKGLRSVLALLITFWIIIKFIVPRILAGANPIWVTVWGCLFILLVIIYLTEGFNLKSHLAVGSIFLSLVITGLLAGIFTDLIKLSGAYQEEIMFLVGFGYGSINFKGLLLAGILIGALGVLDDVVISQISAVKEIKIANDKLSAKEVYKKAMRIGVSHMGSMVNTLFMVYAGASLPLLLLFSLNSPPFLSFSDVINNQLIATEIVRSMVGAMGIILSIPISTFLASTLLKLKKSNN